MKLKKILLFIGLFPLTATLFGQDNPIEFGLKAGLNYSDLIIDKNLPFETNSKFGFHVGGFLNFPLNEKIALKPELLFSTQGAEYELSMGANLSDPGDPLMGGAFKVDIKESLILVPIMLVYSFSQNFDLELGPQFGYVIDQNVSDNNDNFETEVVDYEKFEVGLNVGAGLTFAEKYRLGLRYNYGLTERDNYRSSVFQLGLGYKF